MLAYSHTTGGAVFCHFGNFLWAVKHYVRQQILMYFATNFHLYTRNLHVINVMFRKGDKPLDLLRNVPESLGICLTV